MFGSLAGRTAVVTGASRGIGRGIARRLGSVGCNVLVIARSLEAAESVAHEILDAGGAASAAALDVSDPEQAPRMAATAIERYGAVDILCANAGIFPVAKLDRMTAADFDAVIATNLRGTFLSVSACVPALKARGRGRIVLTSSVTGPVTGYPGWAHYGASKAGQLGFMRTAAIELAPARITVNAVMPGNIATEGLADLGSEYVARMEDVLDLYAEPEDPNLPIVCFDETPRQLIGEARVPCAPAPGRRARWDYEYRRNGTANVFMFLDVHRPWRHVKVTDRRANPDFAECMRDLVDVHYPHAARIRVVLDNLSTHSAGALYETFLPEEARRILRRLEFHYTPKHASWLNMVEIEIGVLVEQCLDRRIPDKKTLKKETAAWERRRNGEKARIKWLFTVERARTKLGRAYPGYSSSAPGVAA